MENTWGPWALAGQEAVRNQMTTLNEYGKNLLSIILGNHYMWLTIYFSVLIHVLWDHCRAKAYSLP